MEPLRRKMIICLASCVFLLFASYICLAAETLAQNPGAPVPGPPGALNPRTGEIYPQVPGGVLNPRTGEVYPQVPGGVLNPRTGEVYPNAGNPSGTPGPGPRPEAVPTTSSPPQPSPPQPSPSPLPSSQAPMGIGK